jgi:hypothetical protein
MQFEIFSFLKCVIVYERINLIIWDPIQVFTCLWDVFTILWSYFLLFSKKCLIFFCSIKWKFSWKCVDFVWIIINLFQEFSAFCANSKSRLCKEMLDFDLKFYSKRKFNFYNSIIKALLYGTTVKSRILVYYLELCNVKLFHITKTRFLHQTN